MTDADRYARVLGKGFISVRATLCSKVTQHEAAARTARYLWEQFRKDVPDLKGLLQRATSAIALSSGLFGAEEELRDLERSGTGTLGAEHFIESLRLVIDGREPAVCILEHLADRVVASLIDCVDHQSEYRADMECQAAVRRHGGDIRRDLRRIFAVACGLEAVTGVRRPARYDQAALLDFVVVPKE